MVITIIAITVMRFGVLGISAWVGIRFPYHRIPMRERWAHRRSWKQIWARWLVLVVTPYGLVPAIVRLHHAHAVALGDLGSERADRPTVGREYALGVLMACGLSFVAAVFDNAPGAMGLSSQENTVGVPGRSVPRFPATGKTRIRPVCTVCLEHRREV